MTDWAGLGQELQNTLRLRTNIVAYRRFDKVADLEKLGRVYRVRQPLFTFCQLPFLARVLGATVGVTREDRMLDRCMRIFGLKAMTEEAMTDEANMLATTWFCSAEDSLRQLKDSARVPVGEAIAVSPLSKQKFEPEVVLVFANPAQMMMLLCGLHKERYDPPQFGFIGEGSCADSLPKCYVTGKPAVSIPCYAERAFGQVADDEMAVALPPADLERAVAGLRKLAKAATGLTYPIQFIGGLGDVSSVFSAIYPAFKDTFKKAD